MDRANQPLIAWARRFASARAFRNLLLVAGLATLAAGLSAVSPRRESPDSPPRTTARSTGDTR